MKDMALDGVQSRINLYQFLSYVFNREVTAEFYLQMRDSGMMALLVEKGYLPSRTCSERSESVPGPDDLDKFMEELECEFARLFIGPGKHLPPYESVHRGNDGSPGLLWGETTADVNRFYEYYGFDFTPRYGGIPDHFSIEFEFIWKILSEEMSALGEGDVEKADHCRKVQREFFNKHIITWVPGFCEKILEWTQSPFYRGIAALTKDFVEEEDGILNHLKE